MSLQRLFGCCLSLVAATAVFGQKKTLESYVLKNAQAISEGKPLLYLEGKRVISAENSLAGFRRKVISQGAVKVVVPIDMVFVDDSLKEEPDLYDGLDLRTKALYLVSTLTPNQFEIATSKGIGFGDLSAEQKRVLDSLIPKNFKVERREASDDRYKVADSFLLDEGQRKKVRFKLTRSISFDLQLVRQPGAYCPTDSMDHLAMQNLSGYARVEGDQESGPDELFGLKFRKIVPNQLKPTDLDYTSSILKKTISINAPIALSDVFQMVKKSVGVSIIPDPRVAKRMLSLVGNDVKISDLLPAIAQMVTGTYRRVGPDYVLTSDLRGLGTKKLRLDQWQCDVEEYVEMQKPAWYKAIAQKKLLSGAKASSKDIIQPGKKFEEYLATNDAGGRSNAELPPDLIDSGVQELVRRFNKVYTSQEVSTTGVRATSNLRFNFTLPNGQDVLEPGGVITPYVMVNQTQREPYNPTPGKVEKKIADTATVGLGVRLSEVSRVKVTIELAKKIGFKEIWLETLSEAVLQSAVTEGNTLGIGVRLLVHPWKAWGSNDLDRTLLGDHADKMRSWVSKNKRLNDERFPFDFIRVKSYPENSISPDQRPESWSALRKLTRTPGLTGIIVADQQTMGYESKADAAMSFGTSPSDLSPRKFGYSLSMRSAFLRENGVDPIDLVPAGLRSSINTSPYFFPDMELMGFPRTYGSSEGEEYVIEPFVAQWHKFRSKAMLDGLNAFIETVLKDVQIPIWSDLLVGTTNKASNHLIPLTDFSNDRQFQYDISGAGMPFGVAVQGAPGNRFVVDGLESKDLEMFMGLVSRGFRARGDRIFCYDVSRMSSEEVEKFLTLWFDQKQ